jgi:hypothetical protein
MRPRELFAARGTAREHGSESEQSRKVCDGRPELAPKFYEPLDRSPAAPTQTVPVALAADLRAPGYTALARLGREQSAMTAVSQEHLRQ